MRVKLYKDKPVEFVDGSGTINANDVMRQKFQVETEEGVITGNESLWVSFKYVETGVTYTTPILLSTESGEENLYSILIPQELFAYPGEWSFQLFVRLYSKIDATKYLTQLATDPKSFNISDGLPLEDNAPVNEYTVQNLWEETKQAVEEAGKVAEAALNSRIVQEAGTATDKVMSQNAVTKELDKKANVSDMTLQLNAKADTTYVDELTAVLTQDKVNSLF